MILIDSLYINNGGGKILLDYLVKKLEVRTANVFYLFDKRCENDFSEIPLNRKIYMESSLLKRHQFYKKNKNNFSTILCFGNIPPTIKLDVPVYTYLHQRLFIEVPKDLPIKQQILFRLKSRVFKLLSKNTDLFIVQSSSMKAEFLNVFSNFTEQQIKVIPFYERLNYPNNIDRIKDRLIYVSGGAVHKNHKRLLIAFEKFYDKHKKGELVLTVSSDFTELYVTIMELIGRGYPLINLGFVPKDDLGIEYQKAEYTIFPSLSESFGLGIVEALEGNCKVIGADLPYMHAVCKPSLTFNPLDIESIESALEQAFLPDVKESEQRIYNNITNLIALLNQCK